MVQGKESDTAAYSKEQAAFTGRGKDDAVVALEVGIGEWGEVAMERVAGLGEGGESDDVGFQVAADLEEEFEGKLTGGRIGGHWDERHMEVEQLWLQDGLMDLLEC